MNKKYKVEFVQKEKYIIDVVAESEDQAREIAETEWEKGNYQETGDYIVEIDTVYDVTGTDDPFDPVNCIHSECEDDGTCKVCGIDVQLTNNGIK